MVQIFASDIQKTAENKPASPRVRCARSRSQLGSELPENILVCFMRRIASWIDQKKARADAQHRRSFHLIALKFCWLQKYKKKEQRLGVPLPFMSPLMGVSISAPARVANG